MIMRRKPDEGQGREFIYENARTGELTRGYLLVEIPEPPLGVTKIIKTALHPGTVTFIGVDDNDERYVLDGEKGNYNWR